MTNDINTDEIRRQLRESAADQAAAGPVFESALDQLFDPETGATEAQKAGFLGVPHRRSFIVGGTLAAGAAFLAACGKKKTTQVPLTGPTTSAAAATTTIAGSAANDTVLLRTAQSIELLAIDTYTTLISGGLATTPSVLDAFKLFQQQHQQHADALAPQITASGGKVVTTANQYLLDSELTKAIGDLTDEKSVLALARDIENIAAQTYTGASGGLTVPSLRVAAMTIGNVEARHIMVLNLALGYSPVPLPVMSTAKAIDPKGYLK